jgi:hypothetical protein
MLTVRKALTEAACFKEHPALPSCLRAGAERRYRKTPRHKPGAVATCYLRGILGVLLPLYGDGLVTAPARVGMAIDTSAALSRTVKNPFMIPPRVVHKTCFLRTCAAGVRRQNDNADYIPPAEGKCKDPKYQRTHASPGGVRRHACGLRAFPDVLLKSRGPQTRRFALPAALRHEGSAGIFLKEHPAVTAATGAWPFAVGKWLNISIAPRAPSPSGMRRRPLPKVEGWDLRRKAGERQGRFANCAKSRFLAALGMTSGGGAAACPFANARIDTAQQERAAGAPRRQPHAVPGECVPAYPCARARMAARVRIPATISDTWAAALRAEITRWSPGTRSLMAI